MAWVLYCYVKFQISNGTEFVKWCGLKQAYKIMVHLGFDLLQRSFPRLSWDDSMRL